PQARSIIAKHRQRHSSQACCARPLGGRQRRAGSQAETSKSIPAFRKLFNRSLPPRASMLQKKIQKISERQASRIGHGDNGECVSAKKGGVPSFSAQPAAGRLPPSS